MGKNNNYEENFIERWTKVAIENPSRIYRALFYTTIVIFCAFLLFPFYWLLVLALTPNSSIVNMGLVPKGFNPESFIRLFEVVPIHHYIFNSIVIGILTTIIVTVFASLGGYVFGRLNFYGKRPLLLLVLAISYFPPAAFLVPLFRLFTGNVSIFGLSSPVLFNTPGSMIIPFTALFMPLGIFILSTFYSQIPDGLEDAARVEGTTRLGALFRVIMPLSAPGVATVAILTFISVYNEFFFSFLMTDGQASSWAPLVWGLTSYQSQYTQLFNLVAAASIIGVIPVAVFVIFAQEKIVSGLTSGALKE